MKNKWVFLFVLSLVGFGTTSFAESETRNYDAHATHLLTKVFETCPIQFIQAMTGATHVGSATTTTNENSDVTEEITQIETIAAHGLPSISVEKIATLTIVRVARSNDFIQDGGQFWQTQCQLSRHKK